MQLGQLAGWFVPAARPLDFSATEGHAPTMTKPRTEVLKESQRKGVAAGAAAAATVVLGVTVGAPLAVVAAVPAAVLGWRWWKHRAENGIRF